MAAPSSVSSFNSSKAHRLFVVLGLAIAVLAATWVVTQLNGSGTTLTGASLSGSAIELQLDQTRSGIEDGTVADGLDQPGSIIIEPDGVPLDGPAGSGATSPFKSAADLTNGEDPVAGLVSWADVDAGSKRLPTVTIDDSIYPQVGDNGDRTGVQFFVNGVVDDRNSKARPDGWDATGPQEGSTFHVYPKISLSVGDVIQARWVTPGGDIHVSELVVGGGEPVAPQPVLVVEDVPPPAPSSVPLSGDFPSAATTGLSDPSVLTPSGTVIVTTPGAVIENLDVTGMIVVEADNVTIRNVRVRKSLGASYGIKTGFGEYTGTVIEHVELDGQRDVSGNSGSIGVCCGSYTLRYANIYGFRVSAKMSGDNVIENSWMHDHWGANGSHGTAVSTSGGSNLVVRNNNLDITGSSGASAALSLYGDVAPVKNVLIERNLFYGGGYCTYGGSSPNKTYPVGTHIRYIDNHFRTTPGTYENCGIFGPVANFNPSHTGNVWQGNVWHETGQPLP